MNEERRGGGRGERIATSRERNRDIATGRQGAGKLSKA